MEPLTKTARDAEILRDKKFLELCEEARARSDETEAQRALPKDLARKLAAADLLAMFVPSDMGRELSPPEAAARLQGLARYDAASAWVAMIGSTASLGAAYLEPEIAKALMAPDKITCGIFAPMGVAEEDPQDPDTYIVSGRWAWASGSANADTIGLGCRVKVGDKMQVRLAIAPRADVIFHDTWHTLGLRGTSSGDVELKEARIPKAHTYTIQDTPRVKTPLYKMPYFGVLATGVAAVALGHTATALDSFLELATAKTPMGARNTLAEKSRVQAAYAQSLAGWRAAHDYFWASLDSAWAKAQSAEVLDDNDKADLRLASTHTMRQCLEVIRSIHDLAGGTAVYDKSHFQRHLRDAETMSQHMITGTATYDMAGRVFLTGTDTTGQL